MTSQGRPAQGPENGRTGAEEQLGDELKAVTSVGESEDDESPPLDLVFGILKNSRRRKVIKYLRQREERISMSDLAEHIAAVENGTTPRMLTSKQRKRVYVALYQCHLPKMDDAGVVDFNNDRGTIELGEEAVEFEAHLKAANLVESLRQ